MTTRSSGKPRALLIDDDEIYRKTLQAAFQKLGVELTVTDKMEEFRTFCERLSPDLLLIDLQLGQLGSGFDLITEMRKRKGSQLPILVISGSEDPLALSHALELGANDFLPKPMDRDFLASKLSKYLQSEALDEHRSKYLELPEGKAPAKLLLEAELVEIDELGIKLQSTHLISKGTVLKLSGSAFEKILGSATPPLVTVVNNWKDPNGVYGAYAEFDDSILQVSDRLHQWLTSKDAGI